MSILQNFKDADHTFEKKFFGAILTMALLVAIFFFIDRTFDKIPDVKHLFINNAIFFRWFIFSAAGVLILSYMTYMGTLDFWEAETKATVRVSIISVVLWAIIWVSWGIFCAWLTLTFNPLTQLVKLTIFMLITIPALTAFLISINIRHQQLKEEETDKHSKGADYSNSDPYIICIDRKYYSGYYGLLCFPVYIVSLLVGQFF